MKVNIHHGRKWSDIGLNVAIYSLVVAVLLSAGHGFFYVQRSKQYADLYLLFSIWSSDFRYLAEQLIYCGVLLFIGAKFFETRKLFTVAFDNVDAQTVRVMGPDDENTVWIGQRYGSRVDAEAVATAFENRLRDSVATS